MDFKLDGVRVSYRSVRGDARPALDGVSLSIAGGESVGIVGREGAGKSTLLMLLDALIFPESGKVTVGGMEVRKGDRDLPRLRSRIGFGFQFPQQQFLMATVREEIGLIGETVNLKQVNISAALAAAGLSSEECAVRSPFTLSLGEARRLSIALAVVSQPDSLLLDEPTAGMDGEGRKWVTETVMAERERGATVVIVSHDLDFLAETADRLIALDQGSIAIDAGIDALFDRREQLKRCGYDTTPVVRLAEQLALDGVLDDRRFLRPSEAARLMAMTG